MAPRTRFRILLLLVGCLSIVGLSEARGSTPAVMNYQGLLTDLSGNPMDTTVNMTFRVYDALSGGNPLWSETHAAVVVTDGLYQVSLGSVTAFLDDLWDLSPRYLGVSIGADAEVNPRTFVAAAPYSLTGRRLRGDVETAPSLLVVADPISSDTLVLIGIEAVQGLASSLVTKGRVRLANPNMGTIADVKPEEIVFNYPSIDGGYQVEIGNKVEFTKEPGMKWVTIDTTGVKLSNPASGSPSVAVDGRGYLVAWRDNQVDTATTVGKEGIKLYGQDVIAVNPSNPSDTGFALLFDERQIKLFDNTAGVHRFTGLFSELRYNTQSSRQTASSQTYKDGSDSGRVSFGSGNFLISAPTGGKRLDLDVGEIRLPQPVLVSPSVPNLKITFDSSLAMEWRKTADSVAFRVKSDSVTVVTPMFYISSGTTLKHEGPSELFGPITTDGTVRVGAGAPPPPGSKLHVNGDFTATGAKLFVQDHPTDPNLEVVYVALEGNEAGTYTRGSSRLVKGVASIQLPSDFALVTNEAGLTVQVTPRGPVRSMLYVESVTASELVVRSSSHLDEDARFDFMVNGVRRGFENHQSIRPKQSMALK